MTASKVDPFALLHGFHFRTMKPAGLPPLLQNTEPLSTATHGSCFGKTKARPQVITGVCKETQTMPLVE